MKSVVLAVVLWQWFACLWRCRLRFCDGAFRLGFTDIGFVHIDLVVVGCDFALGRKVVIHGHSGVGGRGQVGAAASGGRHAGGVFAGSGDGACRRLGTERKPGAERRGAHPMADLVRQPPEGETEGDQKPMPP